MKESQKEFETSKTFVRRTITSSSLVLSERHSLYVLAVVFMVFMVTMMVVVLLVIAMDTVTSFRTSSTAIRHKH
jgi:hypothetical protein